MNQNPIKIFFNGSSEEKYWGKEARKRLKIFNPKKAVPHEDAWESVEVKK
jgi:hypothetical protein